MAPFDVLTDIIVAEQDIRAADLAPRVGSYTMMQSDGNSYKIDNFWEAINAERMISS